VPEPAVAFHGTRAFHDENQLEPSVPRRLSLATLREAGGVASVLAPPSMCGLTRVSGGCSGRPHAALRDTPGTHTDIRSRTSARGRPRETTRPQQMCLRDARRARSPKTRICGLNQPSSLGGLGSDGAARPTEYVTCRQRLPETGSTSFRSPGGDRQPSVRFLAGKWRSRPVPPIGPTRILPQSRHRSRRFPRSTPTYRYRCREKAHRKRRQLKLHSSSKVSSLKIDAALRSARPANGGASNQLGAIGAQTRDTFRVRRGEASPAWWHMNK
jgi:hypothetical protein